MSAQVIGVTMARRICCVSPSAVRLSTTHRSASSRRGTNTLLCYDLRDPAVTPNNLKPTECIPVLSSQVAHIPAPRVFPSLKDSNMSAGGKIASGSSPRRDRRPPV